MIRAAIVGLGRWGQTLVNSVQGESEKLRFTHAVSRDPVRVRDFTAEHGLETVGALAAVVQQSAIYAVVLSRLHALHLEQISPSVRAGQAVFSQKPPTFTKADALRATVA